MRIEVTYPESTVFSSRCDGSSLFHVSRKGCGEYTDFSSKVHASFSIPCSLVMVEEIWI